MPRSVFQFYPDVDYCSVSVSHQNIVEGSVTSDEESSELDNDVVEEMDVDSFENVEGQESDMFKLLKTVPDEILTFVAAACFDRISDSGFRRFLSSHNEEFKRDAMKLWKNNLSDCSKHFICNNCGTEVQNSKYCCGAVIKYIRIGGMSQLVDLVAQHIEKIKEVRRNLKTGSDTTHNLNSSHFQKMWKNEKGNMMIMTLLASIDGVSLSGNTKNKLWPVTFSLVDLPTAEMQRATNMVLHGIAEGAENPSTAFWNKIVPMVYTDVEGSRHAIGNSTIQFMIGTWIADQPAKRSLFGFKACNGESSCFYGLCSGTHHKKQGPNRETERPDELTVLDATNGTNGFGTIPPRIVDFVLPYDTVLDLLHNAAEGIFSIVIRESLASGSSQPRSDLFQNDRSVYLKFCDEVIVPSQFEVKNITNCSEKLLFFRIHFGLAALCNDSLKPEARITICSLMLILNRLYTNAPSSSNRFFAHLTGAARWALEQASPTYMGTKTHEFLCHLPYVIEKFGNIAPLSTFCFEHFYKHSLKGFSAQKTTGFTEAAVSRVILHSSIRREIVLRSRQNPSQTLSNFLLATPSMREFEISWKNPIRHLEAEDQMAELQNLECYATLFLSVGRLQSRYKQKHPNKNEIFFAKNDSGLHCCYRFIAVCVSATTTKVIGERIRDHNPSGTYPLLQKVRDEMRHPLNTYGHNVLNQFKSFNGIVHGRPSGERELLEVAWIQGVGGVLPNGTDAYFLQLNGALVHH